MKQDNTSRIQVLERATEILDLFSLEHAEWRFSDIVAASGLNKSTVFNIVNTLRELDFLEQDEETKKYRLGRRMVCYGEVAKKSVQIVKIAQPYMVQMRDTVNETVQLAKLDKSYTIYLSKAESLQPVQTHSMMGAAIPAYATGLGKVMLAYKDEAYIDTYFSNSFEIFTEHTLRGKEELKEELTHIRQAGMACDQEEYCKELICYACPIFDHQGRAVYAVSISTPTYRMTKEKEIMIQKELKEKSLAISKHLGYSGRNTFL